MRRLARWCAAHRRLVVVLWLVAVVGVTLAGRAAGTGYSDTFSLAGTESTAGAKLLQAAAPRAAGSTNHIVVTTRRSAVTDAAIRSQVGAMLEQVARLPHVGAVGSPYAAGGAAQISRDGRTAFATVTFDQEADQLEGAQIRRVIDVAKSAASAEFGVELGGDAISRTNGMETGGLPIGMGAAGLVLLLVFGSLLAAAVPLITAGFALITGVAAIGLLSNIVSMPEFSTELALLVGLGVGVDYALFIVTRYRQALMRGLSSDEAIAVSLDTSGRAVVFAGVTVCIALLGMLALNVGVLGGMGVAASLVVAFTVLTAVTLLPALLSLFGKRLLTRGARRALAAGRLTADDESPFWGRWARTLRARPAAFTAVAAVMLAIVAIPFLSLRVGATDAGLDPPAPRRGRPTTSSPEGSAQAQADRCSSSPTSAHRRSSPLSGTSSPPRARRRGWRGLRHRARSAAASRWPRSSPPDRRRTRRPRRSWTGCGRTSSRPMSATASRSW